MLRENINCRASRLCGGIKPASIINLVGDQFRESSKKQSSATIHGGLIYKSQTGGQQFHSRSFINPAALSADNAVFQRVLHADTIESANRIRLNHSFQRSDISAIDLHGAPLFKAHCKFFNRIRGICWPDTHGGLNNQHGGFHTLQIFGLV